ncbi:MAG: SIS domain-containing protein [Chloroflexota bacterium]|nr:SIS domain-containing protein [Chloroflexota bacterium]
MNPELDRLLTWREASTSGDAIAAALASARATAGGVVDWLGAADRLILTGAGSSYYLAQVVAAVARDLTGRVVLATPPSELILRPAGVLGRGPAGRQPVIVISRSGSTSEAVEVVERMGAAGHPTIAVTCRDGSPLATRAERVLLSPAGDEQAVVMTRSFASMLALLLRVVAAMAGDRALGADLDRLPECWPEAVAAAEIGAALGSVDRSRVVILGGGPAHGIASEWGLKLTETSQVAADVYEPLEFRHGPISVCEPGVLVVGLVGGPSAAAESRVVAETAGLGAETWLIGHATSDAGRPADRASRTGRVSAVGSGLHPWARLPLLVYPAHALALSLALTRGRDPDAPRHLGQVVILDPA